MSDKATYMKDSYKNWLFPGLLVLAGILVYMNSLSAPFILDDTYRIESNTSIRQWSDLHEVLGNTSRPMVNLTLAVNYALGGLNVTGYHIFNIIVHIAASLVLFQILRRTFCSQLLYSSLAEPSDRLAFAVALIWLVHPLNTQAVTYTIQRGESMMGLFYLLTLYSVILSVQTGRKWSWTIVAILSCILGMATKEVMVTAPLLVLLYDRTFVAGTFLQALKQRKILYSALAATWILLYVLVRAEGLTSEELRAGFNMASLTPLEYLQSQPQVILHYWRLSLWPDPLVFDYLWPVARTPGEILPSAILIFGILVFILIGLLRKNPLAFLGAWFFLILSPTSSVYPIADVAVEHRMYLSLAAVIIVGVFLLHCLQQKLISQSAVAFWIPIVILALILGTLTIRRNQDYLQQERLWRSVLEERPQNWRAHYNIASLLQKQERYPDAIDHFHRAIRIKPDHTRSYIFLGNIYGKQGNFSEAIRLYRQALEIEPDNVLCHYNLGLAWETQGKTDKAREHFQRAIPIKDAYIKVCIYQAADLMKEGKTTEAIHFYQQAVQISPESAEAHYGLGVAYSFQEKFASALRHFQKAASLKPAWAVPVNAMAWTYAAHPGKTCYDPKRAVNLAEQAAEMTQYKNAEILDTLAVAYAADNRFDQAIETSQQAIKLALAAGDTHTANQFRNHLESFQQKIPIRQP